MDTITFVETLLASTPFRCKPIDQTKGFVHFVDHLGHFIKATVGQCETELFACKLSAAWGNRRQNDVSMFVAEFLRNYRPPVIPPLGKIVTVA